MLCIGSTKAVNNSNCQVSEGDHRQKIIRTFSGNKKPVVEGRTVEPFLLCCPYGVALNKDEDGNITFLDPPEGKNGDQWYWEICPRDYDTLALISI